MTVYVVICADLIASIAKGERSEELSSLVGPFDSREEAEAEARDSEKFCAGKHLVLKAYR